MLISHSPNTRPFHWKYICLLILSLLVACQPTSLTPIPPTPTSAFPTALPTHVLPFISLEQNEGFNRFLPDADIYQEPNPAIFLISQFADTQLIRALFPEDLEETLKTLDYQTSFALAIMQGAKGPTSFGVEVTQITQNGQALHVEAIFHEPGTGDPITDVISYPYEVIQIQAPYDPAQMQIIYLFVNGKVVATYPPSSTD